ncbi:MAG TPA: hypothetical protein VGK67_27200 [Myxococcales bacterium]|jgi:hypothetical protein
MWFPNRPQATGAERAILRFLAPPAVLLVLGALAWQSCTSFNLERRAQKNVRAACVASGLSEPECKLKVKQRGDPCWERHYFPGRKGIQPNLNETAYRTCILETEPGTSPSPSPSP